MAISVKTVSAGDISVGDTIIKNGNLHRVTDIELREWDYPGSLLFVLRDLLHDWVSELETGDVCDVMLVTGE